MKYFKDTDFLCKCGCGTTCTDELKQKLDNAREYAGIPFIINSPARCAKHNASVGGAKASRHLPMVKDKDGKMKSDATDIRALDGKSKFLVVKGMIQAGFKGIGINFTKGFVHGDLRPDEIIFPY